MQDAHPKFWIHGFGVFRHGEHMVEGLRLSRLSDSSWAQGLGVAGLKMTCRGICRLRDSELRA